MKETEPVESYLSADEVLAEALQDAAVRAKWDETRLARDVALWLVSHRGEHGLTQSALAEQLGWKQPVVARLERGDHAPSMATLQHLVQTLGGQARISIDSDGVRLIVRRQRGLNRLRTPASLESPDTAARTLETAAHKLSMRAQGDRRPSKRRSPKAGDQNPSTPDEKVPRRRNPKLSIEKIREALLERAMNVGEPITQELIADDLGSTPNTLRKLVSGSGWDAEVRQARRLATDSNSA
jgi:transcriptional regulator with XRE-family HTH domain